MVTPILPLALLFAVFLPAPAAQSNAAPTQAAPQAAPRATAPLPSAALEQPIQSLRSTLTLVRVDKWKTSNPIRDAASTNLESIQRDLDTTLPPLVKTADAAPASVTALLPVFRNINALYDVLLRVSTAAEPSAPRPQAESLQNSLSALEHARRVLGDSVQAAASAQDQQLASLRAQLAAAQAAPSPQPTPAPAPNPKPKAKKKKTAPAA